MAGFELITEELKSTEYVPKYALLNINQSKTLYLFLPNATEPE